MKTIYTPAYRRLMRRLRKRRETLGYTQTQAGKKMGHSRNWLSAVESGQTRLDLIQFIRLCRIYNLNAACEISRVAEEFPSDEGDSFSYYRPFYLP